MKRLFLSGICAGALAIGSAIAETSQDKAQDVFDQGYLYHLGQGVVQNYATAVAYFEQAAALGHPVAQNLLGQYLHAGLGGTQDEAQAIAWFARAAETGEPAFLHDYALALEARGGEGDLIRAAGLYEQAAAQGFAESLTSLGVLYQSGQGVAQDLARALGLFEEAAKQGHARAQNNLGLLYVRGEGVAQDYARAAALFTQAAEQGLPVAMTNLGVMYENGFGVAVDEARAAELYRLGARDGQALDAQISEGPLYDPRLAAPEQTAEAQAAREKAAQFGDPVALFQLAWLILQTEDASAEDLRRAAGWLTRAAQAGYAPAMANLGWLHFEGRGVAEDYALGYMWLSLATTSGFPGAASIRDVWAHKLSPEQVNEAQTLAEFWVDKN